MASTGPKQIWRIPRRLPPCWWLEGKYSDGSVRWNGPFDSRDQATNDWLAQNPRLLGAPSSIRAVQEDAEAFTPRSLFGEARPANITARWNWFRRHRSLLLKWAAPKPSVKLVPLPANCEANGDDLLSHRLGGPAILPAGMAWPTFEIDDWTSTRRRRKQTVLATFVATLDLRGFFDLGRRFPDAVSLFLSTYDVQLKEYCDVADPYVNVGIVIPLFEKDRPTAVDVPDGGLQLDFRSAKAFEVPDFPPYSMDLSDAFGLDPPIPASFSKSFYDEISQREPGTQGWINVGAPKIGGYEYCIQHSVRTLLQEKRPESDWHYIATWRDERIPLGDSGQLYVLAGYDKKSRNWTWHCEWDCH